MSYYPNENPNPICTCFRASFGPYLIGTAYDNSNLPIGVPIDTPPPTAIRELFIIRLNADKDPNPTEGSTDTHVPAFAKPNSLPPFCRSVSKYEGNGIDAARVDV
mmetsp:Transcript_31998/g.54578  ORF Transcript_31998/g.54578 Transcript_31998/m.54578 type:complete len:105 (+) Transcript_31998:2350-2664(+)